MMRKPEFRPPEWRTAEARGVVEIVRTIEVVTPMFGGGVALVQAPESHLKRQDPVTILRTATVVGQVRFWWRALFGCRLNNLATMQARESELFGAASQPGTVSLRVKSSLRAEEAHQYTDLSADLRYAAFPLQKSVSAPADSPHGAVTPIKGSAEITWICRSADADQVAAAVDAWIVLGGIGGRTRRGFGALQCRAAAASEPRFAKAPTFAEFAARLDPMLAEGSVLTGVPAYWPGNTATAGKYQSAAEAQREAVKKLRLFRQGEAIGRNGPADPRNPKKLGRSRWPEPDVIRSQAQRFGEAGKHKDPIHGTVVTKFPRAAFGLPIIFHFLGKEEPADHTLVPDNGATRMASPLILRPVHIADGHWARACIWIPERRHSKLRVKLGDKPYGVDLTADEIAKVGAKMGLIAGRDSVLAAFFEYFQKN